MYHFYRKSLLRLLIAHLCYTMFTNILNKEFLFIGKKRSKTVSFYSLILEYIHHIFL